MSAIGHPESGFGCSTMDSGDRIFAVSAMKRTPQNTITGAVHSAALRESSSESPTKSAMSWISGFV